MGDIFLMDSYDLDFVLLLQVVCLSLFLGILKIMGFNKDVFRLFKVLFYYFFF